MLSSAHRRLCAALLLSPMIGLASAAQTPVRSAQPSTTVRTADSFAHLPLGFVPNRGQTDAAVQFIARTPSATVYLAGSDAVLHTSQFTRDTHHASRISSSSTIRMHLLGAAAQPSATVGSTLAGTVNYLKGNDSAKWQQNLPQFSSVQLASVYPGIDLKYYGKGSTLEYDFIVAPSSDPARVQLQFEGSSPRISANGDLLLPDGNGQNLRFERPVAYQQVDGKRTPVAADFQVAKDGHVGFKLGAYDHTRELVIDPTLVYLGTLGTGVQQVDVSQIAVDGSGALYMAGTTNDSTFPVTAGAYQQTCGPAAPNYGTYCNGGGQTSAFVAKLSPDGTQLVYATYLSGTQSYEYGDALTVDSAGVVYLAGRTGSDTFPVTSDAFEKFCYAGNPNFPGGVQAQCDGYYARGGGAGYQSLNTPAYFAKLSADGSKLLYASYLGGTQPVYPNSIALDASGNIYLSGQVNVFSVSDLTPGQLPTSNAQFPGVTPSGYLTVASAKNGHGNDQGIGIAAFLSKFSNDGHTLLYGTFFGDNTTAADTYPTTMTVGANGVAFLGGYTDATNFPTTTGALKSSCTSPGANYGGMYCNTIDGYVTAFDTTKAGSASLVYSTRLGGTATSQGSNIPDQVVYGLTADSGNNLFVTGYTFESTFPMASNGYQSSCPNNTGNISPSAPGYIDRCDSAFVLKIDPTGTKILAGTFLGGPDLRSAESVGYGVRLDSKGQVYLYGRSSDGGGDFPQLNPLQSYHSGNNLFISALTPDLSKLLFSTRFTNPSYTDHSVKVGGGLVLDPNDNIYFTGTTNDTTFAGTKGTYNTATTTGGGDHPFFAKLSKVLQPDTTALTITPNPVNQGSSITYKAVVAGVYQTTPVATGTVTFSATNTTPATVLGTATLDGTGTATLTQSAPNNAGTYTVVASYGADANYDVSTSSSVTLNVTNLTPTTTTLTATPGSTKLGQTVTLTAAVAGTGGTPTGSVTFLDGATTLGTANLSGGSATYTTTALSAASHNITARYSGDNTFAGSTSSAQTVAVSRNTVALGLTVTPSVIVPGASATLTATLSGPTSSTAPTGTITFYVGTTPLGSVNIANNGATLMTTALPAGTDGITAVYNGDNLYGTVASSGQIIVVRAAAATTTTLSSSASSISSGSSVTFTATVASAVTSGSPTGTVTFYDGTTSLGTGTLNNGSATYTTSSLSVATHSISAVYSGDGLFLGSTSTTFSQTVSAATISLSASPTSLTITRGSSGTATVTVTPMGSYSGTLTFSCGTLPANASCAFSPATLTFSGSMTAQSTTVTINTKSAASAMLRDGEGRNSNLARVLAAGLFLPIGLLGLAVRRRNVLSRTGLLMLVVAMSLGAIGLSGCGGSSTPTVAAGSYTVPVVATVNGTSTTLNLNVTVQ